MMKKNMLLRTLFCNLNYVCVALLCIVSSVGSASAIVYVDSTGTGGNGSTWGSAYKTIEAAIAGSGGGEEFWISSGTYVPHSPLTPLSGTSFYGGFSGNETSRSQRDINRYPAVIDGQGVLYHLFIINNDVRLDGLVLQGGAATGTGDSKDSGGAIFVNRSSLILANTLLQNNVAQNGGAIYIYEGALEVSGCQFINNQAGVASAGSGGAIWAYSNSPRLTGSLFENNRAGSLGGAIELENTPDTLISACTFRNNAITGTALERAGGAVAVHRQETLPAMTITVEKCLFETNTGAIGGGGLYSNRVHTIVRTSRFIGNTAANGGAVMLDYKIDGPVDKIEQCLFLKNSASIIGGAVRSYARSVEIENSVFAYNFASHSAGGIGFHSGSDVPAHHNQNYTVQLTNCTLYGNEALEWGGAIQNTGVPMLYLYNCILWNNTGGQTYWDQDAGKFRASNDVSNNGSSSMAIHNTDMDSLEWAHGSVSETQTHSFSADPMFVDPDGSDDSPGTLDDDFQLQAGSPCIDRANGDQATECDMDCYLRIDHSGIPNLGTGIPVYADIGAFERMENSATSPCVSCTAIPSYPPPYPPPYTPPSLPPSGDVTIPPIMHFLLGK